MEEFDLKLAFKQLSDVISNINVLEQTLLEEVKTSKPRGGIFVVELLIKLDEARGILRDIQQNISTTITK